MRLSMSEFVQRFPEHAVAQEYRARVMGENIDSSARATGKTGASNSQSALEAMFAQQVRVARLPSPLREYKFHPQRRWRMDFAWPELSLAVEVEGGIWNYGRHNRPAGFISDTEKYNAAAQMGFTVLRFAGPQIRNGTALMQVEDIILARRKEVFLAGQRSSR